MIDLHLSIDLIYIIFLKNHFYHNNFNSKLKKYLELILGGFKLPFFCINIYFIDRKAHIL